MARDQFFADVRHAVAFMAPRVEAQSPFTDTRYIQEMLRKDDPWFSRDVVEAFRPDDFVDDDEGVIASLAKAVEEFRGVADRINPNPSAHVEQRNAALSPFTQIVKIVQDLVREEWLAAANRLLGEAEDWAKDESWPTRRFPKSITEDFIGNYTLDRLVYSAEGAQLALVPVGRFAPGAEGMFDLAVMPAYDSVMVVREKRLWYVHSLPQEENRRDWSKEAFIDKSLTLARLP